MDRPRREAFERLIALFDTEWPSVSIHYVGLWRNRGWDGPANSFEIAHYVQGSNAIYHDGDELLIKEGHLLLLPDTIRNSRSDGGRFKAYYLSFGFIDRPDLDAAVRSLYEAIAPTCRPLMIPGLEAAFAKFLSETQVNRWPPFVMKHYFLQILVKAYESVSQPGESHGSAAGSRHQRLVDSIMDELNENYANRIRISELAERYELNERYLNQIFSSVTGISLGRQLTGIRIEHAKRLLLTTRLTITEIALETGFYDAPHFCKTFKAMERISPTEYKAMRLNGR